MPDPLIHWRQLIVTDDIAAFDMLLVLSPLVRDMVDEDNAIARFRIEDDVLLRLAPGFKLGPVEGIQVGRLHLVPVFHKLQVRQVRAIVLKVEGRVDPHRLHHQARVAEIALSPANSRKNRDAIPGDKGLG